MLLLSFLFFGAIPAFHFKFFSKICFCTVFIEASVGRFIKTQKQYFYQKSFSLQSGLFYDVIVINFG
ncbi:hypothetical protein B0A64_18675 [Flavobacterium araucananum]|uniref:Uncharacterized protein n=1 Tax=Flavobacterium araucananum TaxID=946678 RepID=A0A227NXX7_9FLAO|nr:hypothetical protein B0A64_18675 [Flavobacterium araucananum]